MHLPLVFAALTQKEGGVNLLAELKPRPKKLIEVEDRKTCQRSPVITRKRAPAKGRPLSKTLLFLLLLK
jgi:hypothetical protein